VKEVDYMGMAKAQLMEKEEHERECPECSNTVWVNWNSTPNVKCSECDYEGTVKQCDNCLNLISKDSKDFLCGNCKEHMMRD
jgi:RecJ-like exonuclease